MWSNTIFSRGMQIKICLPLFHRRSGTIMSKQCSICNSIWDDHYTNCPKDGAALSQRRKVLASPATDPTAQAEAEASAASSGPAQQAGHSSNTYTAGASGSGAVVAQPKAMAASRHRGLDVAEGVVRNFHEDVMQSKPLQHWFRSLINGNPFVSDGTSYSFEVLDQSTGMAHHAVLYGKIIRGRFQDHTRIKVFGKRDRSNSILAHAVENLNSNTSVQLNRALSATAVRWITGLVIAVLIYFVAFVDWLELLNTAVNGILGFIGQLFTAILPLIIVIGVLWFMVRKFWR
jgi:hypothetical protein